MVGSWHPLRLLCDGIAVVPLIFLGIALATRYIPVFQRKFFVDDESIQYPMAQRETVTSLYLLLLSFVAPSVMVLAWSWVRRFSLLQTVYSLNALYLALSWTMAVTDVTKIVVGELRPDFLDRCKPVEKNGTWACTGDANLVRNGRVSFPSGHSSLTFSGWSFAALFIWGTLAASSWRRSPWVQSILALFLIPPALVAISRTTDYRHHWQDVTVGSLLGILVSYLWYHSVFGRPTVPYTAVPHADHQSAASMSAGSTDSRMGRPLAASPPLVGPVGAPFLAHEQLAKQTSLRDVV